MYSDAAEASYAQERLDHCKAASSVLPAGA